MHDANIQRLLAQRSFTELGARQRAAPFVAAATFA